MAIRNLRYEGDPILRKTSKEVKEVTPKIRELIDDMLETMYEANGVGLAAPQVGVLKRIVVIDVGEGPLVMVNPQVVKTSGSQTGDEGCLSVPGVHESVKRPCKVHVKYLDEDMNEHDEWAEGFLARVMQHEFDHLEGKLFVDHLSPLRRQMIKSKLAAMMKGKVNCSYKTKPNRR